MDTSKLPAEAFKPSRPEIGHLRRADAAHDCCYHVAAARAVLADRERELLELKGPCSTTHCRLHYAHSGPCNVAPSSVTEKE